MCRMEKKRAIVALCALFTVVFATGLRATHRWALWQYADAQILWYNGGTGEYYDIYQQEAMTDGDAWNPFTVINLSQVGSSGTNDQINSFNGNYGYTNWLGIAELQLWDGWTIIYGRTRLNQYHLDNGSYSATNKKHVACQEIGHMFGLDHNRDQFDTCMNDTILTAPQPNAHDADMLVSIYGAGPPPICETCPRVALQANNGQWVVAEGGGGGQVYANRNAVGPWETFRLVDLGGGYIALQADNGQYVQAVNGGGGTVMAVGNGPWAHETFFKVDLGGGYIALQANNGQYVVAEGGGGDVVNANRSAIGPWETFYLYYLP